MLAFALTLAILALFSVVGAATQALILRRLGLAEILLGPVMGLAVLLVVVVNLGHLLPVAAFAWTVVVLSVIGVLWALRESRKGRIGINVRGWEWVGAVLPFVAVFTFAEPMLRFGFDWLSFSNEDMLNYTSSAIYFLHHAYMNYPSASDYVNTHGLDSAYWFLAIFGQERVGVDYVLSFILALTGLHATQPFMPLIIAIHAASYVAVIAMVLIVSRSLLASGIAAVSLWFCALFSFGTIYQLLGQEAGLALLSLSVCFVYELIGTEGKNRRVPVLAGISVGALGLAYPEVIPFLALAAIVQAGMNFVLRTSSHHGIAKLCAIAMVVACTLWNIQIPQIVILLHGRFNSQSGGGFVASAPYQNLYLVPRGISTLLGLSSASSPSSSIAIFIGLVILSILVTG